MRSDTEELDCPCHLCRESRLRASGVTQQPAVPPGVGSLTAVTPRKEPGRLIPRLRASNE